MNCLDRSRDDDASLLPLARSLSLSLSLLLLSLDLRDFAPAPAPDLAPTPPTAGLEYREREALVVGGALMVAPPLRSAAQGNFSSAPPLFWARGDGPREPAASFVSRVSGE